MNARPVIVLKNALLIAFASYLFEGCYPKGAEYYSDLDLTITDYDHDYDFGNQKYYWMADTVEYITNIQDNEIDEEDVEMLLAQVESNLSERGYEKIPDAEITNADFVITVSVIASKNTGVNWVPGPPYYPE
jgi:hypothetical protein